MDSTKNALAELADDLEEILKDTKSDFYTTRIRKAQRIIAELAKCWKPKAEDECVNDYVEAMAHCREIAEEGGEP